MIFLMFACQKAEPKNQTNTVDSMSDTACLSDFEFYETSIDPIVQGNCSGCHNAQGPASGTRFVLNQNLDDRYDTLFELAQIQSDEGFLLLQKPTNTHADSHAGGEVLSEESEAYNQLELFVARSLDLVDDCADSADLGALQTEVTCDGEAPARRLLRRLSHMEYRNTIRDLFEIDVEVGDFAADNVAFGYNNNATALTVSSLLLDQYTSESEAVATQYIQQTPISEWNCGSANRTCAETFLEVKGTAIWRRPLSEDDRIRYLELYDLAAEDGFESGMVWMLSGLLQSPHFLYRSELGERQLDDQFSLTSWEVATELSYMIWQTTPDSELLGLAETDVLLDPEGRTQAVEYLLADARAAESMVALSEQWLRLDLLPIVARDSTLYGDLTEEIRSDMAQETRTFVVNLFEEEATFSELLTSERTWVSPVLASYYGLETTAGAWEETDLSGDARYGGLLTQGAVLTVHALPSSSSPIHRGVLIREHFLCQELQPPPANLDTSPPPVDPTLSTRERYAQHASDPSCSSCHQLIDPIGFAFEHYDGIGRWRDMDGEHPIDATGEIVESDTTDGTFDGLVELSTHLANSSEVSSCYVQQWYAFGTGRGDIHTEEVACGVEAASAKFNEAGQRLPSAVLALTELQRIHTRVGEAGEMDTLATSTPSDLPDPLPDTGIPVDTGTPEAVDLLVTVTETTNWGAGACYAVGVANQGTVAETWVIEIDVPGTITSLWSAVSEEGPNGLLFSGVDWNATLQPLQSTEFGYCVQL